jgi:hypothetical protein
MASIDPANIDYLTLVVNDSIVNDNDNSSKSITTTLLPDVTSKIINNLILGRTYNAHLTVHTKQSVSISATSSTKHVISNATSKLLSTKPGVPTVNIVNSSNASTITLSNVDNGFSPISDITIQLLRMDNGVPELLSFEFLYTDNGSYVLPNLVNDAQYEGTLMLYNANGASESVHFYLEPTNLPGLPIISLTPGDGSTVLNLRYTYPSGTNEPNIKYGISYGPVGLNNTVVYGTEMQVDFSTNPIDLTFNNLLNGQLYKFRVRIQNSIGWGIYAYATVTPNTAPSSPSNVVVSRLPTDMFRVSFDKPADNGGFEITHYNFKIFLNDNLNAFMNIPVGVSDPTLDICGNKVKIDLFYSALLSVNLADKVGKLAKCQVSASNNGGVSYGQSESGETLIFGNIGTVTNFAASLQANNNINLTWNDVSFGGYEQVFTHSYVVQLYGGEIAEVVSNSLLVDSALLTASSGGQYNAVANAATYVFEIYGQAVNPYTQEVVTGPTSSVSINTAPAPVSNLNVVAGDGTLNINFDTDYSFFALVPNYEIKYSPGNNYNDAIGVLLSSGTSTSATVSGLLNNQTYSVRVRAYIMNGATPAYGNAVYNSATCSVAAPSAPMNLQLVARNASIDASWNAPLTSGKPISGYILSWKQPINNSWITQRLNTATTTYSISNLNNNTLYQVKVEAYCVASDSSEIVGDAASAYATPFVALNAPVIDTFLIGDSSIEIMFSAPSNLVASGVNGFVYNFMLNGTYYSSINQSMSDFRFTGLTNGTMYTISMNASYNLGNETITSNMSNVIRNVIPASAPGSPQNLVLAPSNQQIVVTWNEAVSNGTAIHSYDVYRDNSLIQTVSKNNSGTYSVTMNNLTNGQSHVIEVYAKHIHIGTGQPVYGPVASASSKAFGAPDAATGLSNLIGDKSVLLSWSAPNSLNGCLNAVYDIYISTTNNFASSQRIEMNRSSLSYNATLDAAGLHLANGTRYYFWVKSKATNPNNSDMVSSVAAPPSTNAIPLAPEAQVQNLQATTGDGSITVTWNAPSLLYGANTYDVVIKRESDDVVIHNEQNLSATTFTQSGLSNGVSYSISVKANWESRLLTFSTLNNDPQRLQNIKPSARPNIVSLTRDLTNKGLNIQLNGGGLAIVDYVIIVNPTTYAPSDASKVMQTGRWEGLSLTSNVTKTLDFSLLSSDIAGAVVVLSNANGLLYQTQSFP